jgi:hypothetical protein
MRLISVGLIAGFCLLLVAAVDVAARAFGVLDFPLYLNSATLGYVPAPNQRGSFLGKNDWAFNELSMGVARRFDPDDEPNTLLIGDSIVYGGNPIKQFDKLGPSLNRASCGMIWPASAASWAFLNELRYVHSHADILRMLTRIIFVLNSEDFGNASIWTSEVSHPTYYPVSTIRFLFRKAFVSPQDQPPSGDNNWSAELKWLISNYDGPITFALYPNKLENQNGDTLDADAALLKPYLSNHIHVLLVGKDENWHSALNYRDEIHPSVQGAGVLATILAKDISECANN